MRRETETLFEIAIRHDTTQLRKLEVRAENIASEIAIFIGFGTASTLLQQNPNQPNASWSVSKSHPET
jgi:hypothetical protein